MPRKNLLIIGIAMLLAIGAFLFVMLRPTRDHMICGCTLPPVSVWRVQTGQTSAQDANGVFALKHIDLSSHAFHFFYVYKLSSGNGTPKIDVSGYLPQQSSAPTHYSSTNQQLGQLGSFSLGVIQMDHVNVEGETLVLQITLPGASSPTWKLEFLKQINPEKNDGPVLYYNSNTSLQYGAVPAIQLKGLTSYPAQNAQFGFFHSSEPGAIPRDIFIRIDNAGSVAVISEEEYISIVGDDYLTPTPQ